MKTKQEGSIEKNPQHKKFKFFIWNENTKTSEEVTSYNNGSKQICIRNMVSKMPQRGSPSKQDDLQKKNETKSSLNYIMGTSGLFLPPPKSEEQLPIISPSNPIAIKKSHPNRPWEIETNENYVSPIPEEWPTSIDNKPV